MDVVSIDATDSARLSQIVALADANRATLGFFPAGAFRQYAERGQILAALQDGEVIGYLLYRKNLKQMVIAIVHLCVHSSHRRAGTATGLLQELKKLTRDTYMGIRARCRRDYDANAIWPRLDFSGIGETEGRGNPPSTLTVWWLDHGHPTLFSLLDDQRTASKLKAVIDANVFFDLQEPEPASDDESLALLADWLQEDIELCVTPEIFNEINRSTDASQREKRRRSAHRFVMARGEDALFHAAKCKLRDLFPEHLDPSDESDLRQLAWCAASGPPFFITRDQPLRDRADDIFNVSGVRVLRPIEFIVHQDALVRESEYYPARLAGSLINVSRTSQTDIAKLEMLFQAPQEETRSHFRRMLRSCLAKPRQTQMDMVHDGEEAVALMALDRGQEGILNVPIYRVLRHSLAPTLARHLALRLILTASQENRQVIRITDPFWSHFVSADVFREVGFVQVDKCWLKLAIPAAGTSDEIAARLHDLGSKFGLSHRLGGFSRALLESDDQRALLHVERVLWPCKISDLEIPVFVVPVQPVWAQHLFDSALASQTLFGSDPDLMLRIENAFYRAAIPNVLAAPARILWYVSRGQGKHHGVMSIRACSYLDEIIIGKPKELFRQYRRLGVYKWKDVLDAAGGDYDKDIMAFTFSRTELFRNPVSLSTLRDLWLEETGKQFMIQSPVEASSQFFFKVYEMGLVDGGRDSER